MKEFETVGFYISDHPLNQYKDIFNEYNITKYTDFINKNNQSESMVAATILKIQEKKTQKGTSYAIIKFSDLASVFELFVFSDVFELNRDNIKEGKSVIITLTKNSNEIEGRIRVNVKKIIPIDDILNKPIKNLKVHITNLKDFDLLSKMLNPQGDVEIIFEFQENKKKYTFKLKNKRFVDKNVLNTIKNQGISTSVF